METKIPTAEEFLIKKGLWTLNGHNQTEKLNQGNTKDMAKIMIEFASLHAQTQAETILKKAAVNTEIRLVDIKQLINSYSLNNIK